MHVAKRTKKVGSWQAVGALVAHYRRQARLTQEQFADVANLSVDAVGSIEQGRLALQPDRAEQFDELLGTGGALAVLVAKMPVRERMPQFAQGLVDIEQEAVSILSYQTQMVHGLLQTEDYCRASFDYRFPLFEDETAEQWVASRMERQQIWLRKQPPFGHFILEEAILRSGIGGSAIMREQIRKLREYGDLVHMGLQIMPTGRVPHAGLAGPMTLLETPNHDHAVYLEVQRASFLVEDPDEVSVYQLKYGMLRSQALSPDESARFLDRLLGES
ncbi:helix-turn-helix transcriptional regulator [Streptomyces cylindrosporus]|uniref:Helix-turn-helix domain-containing protein n=1 Tax=Streptomyces cylindrosporus TaxID=2927583 RepID=A0ABS9Y7X9_9ACTN|nr:helix-turn-helix transcriptional regulator [Streptomyces cylindrosporus]MCI3273337.1 helix-turn-helix domain-containing protein [Streptomyces cylindrosporus]